MAYWSLIILTLVFLQILLVFANVDMGWTLSTNDNRAWLSPSGEFAFGFRQINGTSMNSFTVAIWYNRIPDKTIVWYAKANENKLAEAAAGSKVQLTSEGLKLTSLEGVSVLVAQPNAIVSHGAMLDTGNFVLVNRESKPVWESFQNPTDTLLPNQSLKPGGKLTCRFTETNYTGGKFQLYFQDGKVLLSPLAWPSLFRYKSYYTIDASGSASELVFDDLGNIYVETTTGSRTPLRGPKWGNLVLDPKGYYYRATLGFHGVFTQYSHPRNPRANQGWKIMRYIPYNICYVIFNDMGGGSCGYNSICSMDNQRPTCECLYGYSLVDPSNQYGGCQPNFAPVCGADIEARPEQLYELPPLRDINFPLRDYDRLAPCSQEDCRQSCLHDCMCALVVFNYDTGTCWKKSLPLVNGRVEDGAPHVVFIKTRVSPLTNFGLPSGHDSKKEDQAKPIHLGSLVGSLVLNSVLLATLVWFILLERKRILPAATLLETNLHPFTYEEMKNITQDFSEELGRGSSGIVYKGTLGKLSHNAVAIKSLNCLGQEQEKEFKTELSAIGKTYHKNLVTLIGYCDEGIHKLLVYEFMSKGTLADVLFGQPKPIWNQRVGFALGIARGLVYLHEECDTPIIHCDIKPQNILIDDHFTAKISDFGLTKLSLSEQHGIKTMIHGTPGYVAPEWFNDVHVTVQVDVYSFGVMLLEIIFCKRNVLLMESGETILKWAYNCYMERRIDALVKNDKEALTDNRTLQTWVKIAIWCIQEHPK